MTPHSVADLDRAATAREVAILTALVLMKTHGDADKAIATLGELEDVAPPQLPGELDAVSIAMQAIREAYGMVAT